MKRYHPTRVEAKQALKEYQPKTIKWVQAYHNILGVDDSTDQSTLMLRRMEHESQYTQEFLDRGFNMVTAITMGNDYATSIVATEAVKLGARPKDIIWLIGSYARFKWAYENMDSEEFYEILPELWTSSDIQYSGLDTLMIWKTANEKYGLIIEDNSLLRVEPFSIYRGQVNLAQEGLGISWTLDPKVAIRFARTGGTRGHQKSGFVYTGIIKPEDVLAYLDSRSEQEIIVDPSTITNIQGILLEK